MPRCSATLSQCIAKVGSRTRDMLKMGSSRPWPEAMEVITGRRAMSAAPLVRYFEPLTTRLRQNNTDSGTKTGWTRFGLVSMVVGIPVYVIYKVWKWLTRNDDAHGSSGWLKEQLKTYHDQKLKLDDDQTKRAKELVRSRIGDVVKSVKEEIDAGRPEGANRTRIEYTGSMYEGTKFGQPDEFDIMIVIDGSEDIVSEEVTPGYARLRAGQRTFLHHKFSKCLDGYQRNINPTKMLDWFYGLVQKGVNKVSPSFWSWDPISLRVSRHGPAVMVNIQDRNVDIDVDLVLCVQLDQQTYYVAKPYKPYADEPPDWSLTCDPAMLWRQSFSVYETRKLASIDGANECRRDCLRVLKSVFRREPGLSKFTSFHLKTVLLRMCEEKGRWQSSKMDERFLDLLRRIELCLRERRLPHFYLPELNLLDGIHHVTIENMRFRIKRLIDSKHERNKVLYAW